MKKSVTRVKIISEMSDRFNGEKVIVIDDYFVWISYGQGVRIYTIDR
jgi:hypothetical protein